MEEEQIPHPQPQQPEAEPVAETETTNSSKEEEMAPEQPNPASEISNTNSEDHPNQLPNTNGGSEPERKCSGEEVRGVLQVIASTGKFWNDWDELKSMLSFQLKQVLSEYPEAKMADDLVKSTLGETYPDLVKRLDEALHNFPEGPPFTLQRLCEILLDAQNIYPVLSKLALALEKNLLVTSTLSKCTDPPSLAVVEHQTEAPKEGEGNTKPHFNSMENGMEPSVEDRDEVMTEVEEAEVRDDMTVDTENIGGTHEEISQPTHDS